MAEVSGDIQTCPECDGDGSCTRAVCCGNLSQTGECRGDCCVPEQELCPSCHGAGVLELHPESPPVGD